MQNDLTDWLLDHYGQEVMRPGLDRIGSALKDLLPLFSKTKIITIAGTNGKGETTLRLSDLLKDHSHNTWTSPHIERITERFRDENGEIPYEQLKNLIHLCHEEIQKKNLKLSFYEFLFFVFCSWAAKNPPEYLLLEVGLGGRLDAVNVFDADLVLLPSISRDHQEFLGSRYDEILKEKLGTLRSKTQLIHFLETDYLKEKAREIAHSIGAKILALQDECNLAAFEFSLRNQALASAAFCSLTGRKFYPGEWKNQISPMEHRGEIIEGKNQWIFYGSHNVDGMRKLIQFLQSGTYNFHRPPYDSVIVAFSKRSPQDLRVMMRMLKRGKLGNVVVTAFDHPKALAGHLVEKLAFEEGLDFASDIEAYVPGKSENQHVLVTGSYYFLGHFKSLSCCR